MKQGCILVEKAEDFVWFHLLILLMFFLWEFDFEAGAVWEGDDGLAGITLYIGQCVFIQREVLFSEFDKFLFDIFEVSAEPDDFLQFS